jgi:hypothetical protein
VNDPGAVAVLLLDHVAAHLTDPPARRYTSPGETAWDGDQLTCQMTSSYYGQPGRPLPGPTNDVNAGRLRVGVFEVEVVRCTPGPDDDGTPPGAAVLAAAAAAHLADFAGLCAALDELAFPGHSGNPLGTSAWAGPVTAKGPAGGYVSWTTTVHVGL